MMAQDASPQTRRRPFSISADLPDTALRGAVPLVPVLAARLAELMAGAQCHRVDTARRAHDQLADQFDAIRSAAGAFELNGAPLDEVLWIGPAEWRRPGAGHARTDLAAGTELVILFAPLVNQRAAYPSRNPPIAVRDGIAGDRTASGPFLVLMQCERDWLGKAQALRGFAQPILGPDAFMPILADLERSVLRVLMALQERLGDQGWDCVIERTWEGARVSPWIGFRAASGRTRTTLLIACSDSEPRPADAPAFIVTPASFADGRFVRWLELQFM